MFRFIKRKERESRSERAKSIYCFLCVGKGAMDDQTAFGAKSPAAIRGDYPLGHGTDFSFCYQHLRIKHAEFHPDGYVKSA